MHVPIQSFRKPISDYENSVYPAGVLSLHPASSRPVVPKPLAQTITAKKSEGKSFGTPNLFQLLPASGRSEASLDLPAEVRDYQLLQLEEENLQEMIHEAPESFTLSLPGNGRSPVEVELVG